MEFIPINSVTPLQVILMTTLLGGAIWFDELVALVQKWILQ